MITINTYKAQPIGDQKIDDVEIIISESFPNFKEIGEATTCFIKECFIKEGNNIEKALRDSLPGGIYDQLLVAMLTNKASHFVVAFGDSQ